MVEPSQPSESNGQPSVPNDDNVATLLSPPSNLSTHLSTSAKTYKSVIASATNILTESSVDLDAFSSADPDDKASGMREMIVTTKSDFIRFADREIEFCKNLNAYGELLNILVATADTSLIAAALGGRLDAFRKAMAEDSQDRAAHAAKILKHVDTLLTRLADATTAIELLSSQASGVKEELRRQNVGRRLVEALKKLFHLEDDEDGALTQISLILGITVEYLRGDFDNLFRNKKEMQAFIDKVSALQTGLQKVKVSMLTMANGMKGSVEASTKLVGVWDFLLKNIAILKTHAKAPVRTDYQHIITVNWKLAKLAANEAIAAITGGLATAASFAMSQSAATGITTSSVKFPKSNAEVQLFKLAGDARVDHMLVEPEKFSTLSYLAAMPEIVQKHSMRFSAMAAAASLPATDDEKKQAAEELMKKLGPPATESIKTQLEGLSGDCKQVIDTFTTILETPFLQNLTILNPFKSAETPSEPQDLNMREVVTRYKDKYVVIQDETKVLAKSLISYSTLQILLLPRVEIDPAKTANLDPGKITAETYYLACFNAISMYTKAATELRQKHSAFLNQWTQAQINITQRIAECRETAKNIRQQIQEKKAEYSKMTLIGVLEIMGGVACFAIGFVVPFLAPVAWAAGGVLIGVGIKELIDRGELDAAINDLTSKFNAAESAANGLEKLKAPFSVVGTKITNLIGIWDGIEQALTNIQTNVSTLKGMPSGTIEKLWKAIVPANMSNWQDVLNLITQYVNAIQ